MQDLSLLIGKAAKGDEAAFSELVKNTEKTVWRYVYHLVKNSEDAFDVSQETFLKLWKSLRAFRGDCSPTTWILRIAHSCAIDFLRSRKQALPLIMTDAEGEETFLEPPDPDIASNPEKAYERKAAREAVREAVEALPEDQRVILVLRDFDGKSYEEIGKLLDLNEGTVKSRLNRARNAVKKFLMSRNFF